jgi:hypothetical protein
MPRWQRDRLRTSRKLIPLQTIFFIFSRLAKRDTVTVFRPKNDKKTLNTSDYL